MPDILDRNGLQVKSLTELVSELTNSLKAIYGNDINVESNSPDGQQINIYSQLGIDQRELLLKIYNSFDPDKAEGRVLDQRVAINNIKRKQGSFTFQNVEITTDQPLNLVGLDSLANELNPDIEDLFIVKDNAGTEFYLLSSQNILSSGTYSFNFRASEIGKIETVPNTITTPVTVIAGVTGVNNPSGANSIGDNEEKDIELKLRRKISTALTAVGPVDSLEAYLNNLDLVTIAIVYENFGDTTDVNGVPPHSIWCIVEGGTDVDIGEAIYAKRTMGCGMKGSESIVVTSSFTANFDRPVSQDLWIRFSISLSSGLVDENFIKNHIVQNIFWEIGKEAKSSKITAALQVLNENYIIENMEISDDGITYVQLVSPSSLQHKFINDVTRINIV